MKVGRTLPEARRPLLAHTAESSSSCDELSSDFIGWPSQLALADCRSEAGADPARCADLALQTAELMAFHLPANHPTLARLRSIAGRELERAGNRDRGAAVAREGRAIYCVAYGPAHPLANA